MPTSRAYIFQLSRYIAKRGARVVTNSLATRLLMDGSRVCGVETRENGSTCRYFAVAA
jgi:hypothetical protein